MNPIANAFRDGAGFGPQALLGLFAILVSGALITWLAWSIVRTQSAWAFDRLSLTELVRELLWPLLGFVLLGSLVASSLILPSS